MARRRGGRVPDGVPGNPARRERRAPTRVPGAPLPAPMALTTREIRTDDGTTWTLAEAVGSDDERDAAGTVPVVATPSGGAQTVRLALAPGWADADDEALAGAVSRAAR